MEIVKYETLSKRLKDLGVEIYGSAKNKYIYEIEYCSAMDLQYVENLSVSHPSNWMSLYRSIQDNDKVYNFVIKIIDDKSSKILEPINSSIVIEKDYSKRTLKRLIKKL